MGAVGVPDPVLPELVAEPYKRTAFQRRHDLEQSREFEEEVLRHLPQHTIARTDSTTELDFYLPGVYLECKEKRQKLTKRWLLSDAEEGDLFILDELSLRKALVHAPYSWFLLRDVPGGCRLFLASAMEVAVAEKVRRNRVGKGKLILELRQFRQIDSLDDVMPTIAEDVKSLSWKQSACMTHGEPIKQV